MTETLSSALERRAASPQEKTVLDLLQRAKPEIEKALPVGVDIDRFERIVRTELRRTPKLFDCDPHSLLAAVMWSSQLGLEPGPLGHVYLVPFKREVQFVVGYKGIIELAYRSGHLKSITTGIVREGDTFEYRKGSRAFLDHAEHGPPAEREWTHVWALAELKTGGKPFEVLYPEDVEKRKAKSQGATSPYSPWTTDPAAMWRKSAVRALRPYLPQSPPLAQAFERDEAPADPVLDVGDALDVTEPDDDA